MTEESSADPDLEALPAPRRPWRTATLVSLALTLASASVLSIALLRDASYALVSGQPTKLESLSAFQPRPEQANTWVHGKAVLGKHQSGYRRPLDPDRFRLAPVEGNDKLWVELREPEGSLGEHFVPPESFIGRLVPVADPGIRHRGLVDALTVSGQPKPAADAWLLIDGESPESDVWVFGVLAMLLSFAGFSAWGMLTLIRPARS
jgi:hypothetical protein